MNGKNGHSLTLFIFIFTILTCVPRVRSFVLRIRLSNIEKKNPTPPIRGVTLAPSKEVRICANGKKGRETGKTNYNVEGKVPPHDTSRKLKEIQEELLSFLHVVPSKEKEILQL